MLSRILGKTYGKTRGQTGTTRKMEKSKIRWSSRHGTPVARETRANDSHRHIQFRTATGEILDSGYDHKVVGEDSEGLKGLV